MTVQKLSQITLSPSNLTSADYLVGVTAGNVDYRFTPAQIGAAIDITINTTPIIGGTTNRILYDNAGTVGEAASVNFTTSPFNALWVGGTSLIGTTNLAGGNNDFIVNPVNARPLNTGYFTVAANNSGSGGANASLGAILDVYNNDASGGRFTAFYSRGTFTSPAIVQTNDLLGTLGFGGTYDTGVGQTNSCFMFGKVDAGTVSSTSNPAYLGFAVTANGTTGANQIPFEIHAAGPFVATGFPLSFGNNVFLTDGAANVLAQRNGVNAQMFDIYNTFTNASNYERCLVGWTSNTFFIDATQGIGTGLPRPISLLGNAGSGVVRWNIGSGAGFPATDEIFPAGGVFRSGEVAVFGVSDVFFQAIPAGASYTVLEDGGIGLILSTAGSTRTIYIAPARVFKWQFNVAGSFAGAAGAVATNAADGFLYIPTCAGTPIGTPTTITGQVPMVFDTTNSQFWFYTGGAWKQPKTPAGAAIITWQ